MRLITINNMYNVIYISLINQQTFRVKDIWILIFGTITPFANSRASGWMVA